MAIQRSKAATVTTSESVPDETSAVTASTGPVAVPDASGEAPAARGRGRRGGRTGPRGPQLTWGQVIQGDPKLLQKTVVEVAREVSAKYNGRATLTDVVAGLKAHPVFTDNKVADGTPLSDLVGITNVRNKWAELRTNLCVQWAMKPKNQGGLGLSGSQDEIEKSLTPEQWSQMEDAISQPKPEGLNFPKLVIMRGRKGQTLDMDDI